MKRILLPSFATLLLTVCAHAATPNQIEFFENNIRPVLAAECYECHSSAKKKSGLVLDTRDGLLKGGESGPAIVPGQPDSSLLLQALRHTHPKLKMPKNGAKLDVRTIANFAEWIRQGAPDPRTGPTLTAAAAPTSASWADTLAFRRQWWSFQPLTNSAVPTPKNAAWSTNAIDQFLLAKMESRNLTPGPDADPRTLIRRLTFALTGLPPKPEEVEAFDRDFSLSPSPAFSPAAGAGEQARKRESEQRAITRAVDSLLASPAFAERWARHWLDLVRYAESHGSEGDPEIPFAWRYRDYLIRALAADVPANQLIREHIAGDLLPPTQTRWNKADDLNESRLGLAHFRLVEHGFQPVDTLDDQVKAVDSQIDVLAKAFQGLTISCARCHDHKFDPIGQRDYYALYGVLASARPAQVQLDSPEVLNKNGAELLALKTRIKSALADAWLAATPQLIARLKQGSAADPGLAALHERIASAEKELAALEGEVRAKALGARRSEPQQARQPDIAPNSQPRSTNNIAAAQRAALRAPQPISRWSFDTDARDQLGSLHGELLGGATIRDGRLVLDGKEAQLRTAPLGRELREKTLEAWVALANLDQTGGGVVTVETSNGAVFDSIVFGEKEPRKWVNGSNNFRRSRTLDGVTESAKPGELIHLAVVYRPDSSVAFYRNGILYAPAFTPAGEDSSLRTFPADARVLLGRRHTGGGRAFIAGEIEEARLYDRALSAEQISASFRAGPVGVSPEELAKAMMPEQKTRQASLTAELAKSRAELAAKSASGADGLAAALKDAQSNTSNPLHAWAKLAPLDGAAFTSGWSELAKSWRDQLEVARSHNAQFKTEWDFAKGDDAKWFREGNAFGSDALPRVLPGDFSPEPDGDRVLTGLLPASVHTHALSQKHGGLFTSPRFRISTDFISVRAAGGKGAMVRVIVDNYPLGSNPIFPKAELTRDEPGWLRMDTAYRKGSWAYIEFGTADDLTRKLGKNSDAQGRSWFAAERVVFHDKDTLREEPLAPAALLEPRAGDLQSPPRTPRPTQNGDYKSPAPANVAALAGAYTLTLTAAVQAWREDKLNASQLAFLDYFIRRGLLPNSLVALPGVAPLVTEFRRLEADIPTPRRAPGVIETAAHDAPLMPRGDHTKPGETVPRGYLEVLGARDFAVLGARLSEPQQPRNAASIGSPDARLANQPAAARRAALQSGRLELAHAIASPQNPLTARVLVNRVWQHLFGRGLVATVDNFGRLGEQPTHPELLDYLASRFIAEGWSFKQLIRELVNTRAYQLASKPSPRARELDASNELLSHFRVQRLEAEAIRDSLLAVAGKLDATQFGPPASGNSTPRRSIYLAIRRTNLNPFLETFDAPKPFTTLGRRDATNVPAQSLALLNDPFVIDLARAWAAGLIAQEPDVNVRIRGMFAAAFARPPSADEQAKARAYLADLARDANVPADQLGTSERLWQDFAQSLFNLKEFIYVR